MEIYDDFDFVPQYNKSTAAPKFDIPAQPEKKREPTKRVAESANRMVIAIAIMLVSVVTLAMMTSVIYLNKQIVENKHTISSLNEDVAQAKAENVRLNYEMNAMISADKIQVYAVKVLGMQQAERYQIHYFEDRDGDEVVVAGGKASNVNT